MEAEHTVVYTLTFGRAQDIRIAEAAHKGHTAERVQPDGPRAEILHGHIPHLIGQGGNRQETHSQDEIKISSSASHCTYLKSSQVKGISHFSVSITALFSQDGNSGDEAAWKMCLSQRLPIHLKTPHTFPRAGPLPGLRGTEATGKVGGRQ